MIYAVSKGFANRAAISYLRVLLLCPCRIRIRFFRKNKLTLFLRSVTERSSNVLSMCMISVSKFMVDLISICDYSHGESLQEFLGMFRMAGRLPVKENDKMGPAQRSVPVEPHISFFTIFDIRMIDSHDFYQ